MLKKRVKLLATLLALSITAIALVGCGKDEEEPEVSMSSAELAEIADPEDGLGDIIEEENPLEAEVEEISDEDLEAQPLDYTGYDTNGEIYFTIYNNTPFEIFAAQVGSASSSADEDIDILPSTLQPDDTYDFQAVLDESAWSVTDWTIYFTDTDGDTSQSYDIFNAWNVAVINVTWDESNGGYVCDFLYKDELSDEPEYDSETEKNPLRSGNAVVTTEEIVAWNMFFTIYNETPFEILTIKMGPAAGNADDDVDILGSKTLPEDCKLDVEATLSPEWRDITEWTLYITDTDGDTSQIYETFDPWEVTYVDIQWDSKNGGYYCDFVY